MTRCGFITLAGAPNAGKSTLLNRLVGQKISIVTPKVQTTRTRITGIITIGDTQLVFIDTPGIFSPQKNLDKAMVSTAWGSVSHTDICLLLVDAKRGITNEVETILNGLKQHKTSCALVLNKIDLVAKETLLQLTTELHTRYDFSETFMISATSGDGTSDLEAYLLSHVPEGKWMYPEDELTDIPQRIFAAEITREKLMLCLDNELPYKLMVETAQWEEKKGGIHIHQTIYVSNPNYKKIIVGKQGTMLRKIGEMSRKELRYLLEKPVHLFLFVKVQEHWDTSREHYHMMGLDYPTK